MHDNLIKIAYEESRNKGKPIPKEQAEFICEDYFAERKQNIRLTKELEETKEVASWAQAVLTALNVGSVPSECLLHKKLRKVMISYREKLEALEGGGK